jgi:integrase
MTIKVTASMIRSMPRTAKNAPPKGSIRRRGNSLQVSVYAGVDPLTGKRLYLAESTTDQNEAQRILARLRAQVDEDRHARTRGTLRVALAEWLATTELEHSTRHTYEMYARNYINPALGDEPLGSVSARMLERFYAELRRCRARCDGTPFTEHRVDSSHDCRQMRHKRPPGRRPAGGYPDHDCATAGCTVLECRPHECKPLAKATVVKIHHMLSGTFAAAVRWEWIKTNPADVARPPRQPPPQPSPPTVEEAGRIATAAWEQDETWGTLVWLVMVTGLRRAELLALRWRDVNFGTATLEIRHSYVRATEKDTKAHRLRRVALDPATMEILAEHHQRYLDMRHELGTEPSRDAFLFSYEAAFDRPYNPDWVTHRYTKMCAELGISSHLHALRHYSATELLSAGVDLRTVAGRLGHGGGGATTLKVYAAWVGESDRRAAEILGGRMQRPDRPGFKRHSAT